MLKKLLNNLKLPLSILCLCFCSLLGAQSLLVPSPATAFSPMLEFNTEFVKTQKIKTITFDIIDKKDFAVAEDKNLVNYYEFNAHGQLTRFYYTTIVKTLEKEYHSQPVYHRHRLVSAGHSYFRNEYVYDTISTIYMYDTNNNLKMKRYNDGTYYEARYYSYDAKNRLTKEKRFKETNNGDSRNNFVLGTQVLISEDSFQYVDITPLQYKQICLNSENRPYKEIVVNKDTAGHVVSTNEHYTVAWIVQNAEFKYENGILASAEFKGNANGDVLLRSTYECDSANCIYTEKQFRNDILLKEISYVTERNAKFLNSFIVRDPVAKTMRIVKLYYTYFPDKLRGSEPK
jgi:hypothetical protein